MIFLKKIVITDLDRSPPPCSSPRSWWWSWWWWLASQLASPSQPPVEQLFLGVLVVMRVLNTECWVGMQDQSKVQEELHKVLEEQ